jgi:predicted nucleotidyltransferase component of viral defense system
MEQVGFNKHQQLVFDEFAKNEDLRRNFYFTGGTALSVFHLQHRLSEDMDFFSENDFDNDLVHPFAKALAGKLGLNERFTQKESVRMFGFFREGELIVKIDFVHYPYKRIRESKIVEGVAIDNIFDIAINKFLLLNQRMDVKDFVDLYFIKDKVGIWDLMEGVRQKFGFELDPILIAADFMKVEEFDFLPKMLVPLAVSELQNYFKQQAAKISKSFLV